MEIFNTNKNPEPCVKCDVNNCTHNDHNKCCTAKEIYVGPNFATSQADTVCATFTAQK